MGNQVDGRFDRRSSVNWRWKNDPHLISDHLPILIGDQADWSLIGGGKTGPKSQCIWPLSHVYSDRLAVTSGES